MLESTKLAKPRFNMVQLIERSMTSSSSPRVPHHFLPRRSEQDFKSQIGNKINSEGSGQQYFNRPCYSQTWGIRIQYSYSSVFEYSFWIVHHVFRIHEYITLKYSVMYSIHLKSTQYSMNILWILQFIFESNLYCIEYFSMYSTLSQVWL